MYKCRGSPVDDTFCCNPLLQYFSSECDFLWMHNGAYRNAESLHKRGLEGVLCGLGEKRPPEVAAAMCCAMCCAAKCLLVDDEIREGFVAYRGLKVTLKVTAAIAQTAGGLP
jgi:hypothetical protein